MRRTAIRATVVACALLLGVGAQSAAATPLTITVQGFADSSPVPVCSPSGSTASCPTLRSAIRLANLNPGSTITLGSGTYTVGGGPGVPVGEGPLTFAASMTINGAGDNPGPSETTIQQTDGQDSVLHVMSGVVLVNGAVITGGKPPTGTYGAGAIVDSGATLNLSGDLVTGNTDQGANGATPGASGQLGRGGGIYNQGELNLTGTTVTMNTAKGGAGAANPSGAGGTGGTGDGGGIYNNDGTVILANSSVTMNNSTGGDGGSGTGGAGGGGGQAFGGGVSDCGGGLGIATSELVENRASGGAGATGSTAGGGGQAVGGSIAMSCGVGFDLVSSAVYAGVAAGGNSGPVSQAGNAVGGGIWADAGTFTLVNSTVAQNSAAGNGAEGGGMQAAAGTFKLFSDTIAENSSGQETVNGTLNGSGGNIWNSASVALRATIVAGGTAASGANCATSGGMWTDVFSNLEDSGAGSSQCGLGTNDVLLAPGTALIDFPGNNGGNTITVGLAPGSPALGAAGICFDDANHMLTMDQRGRPRSGPCDIGAFQHQPPVNTTAPAISGTPDVGQSLACSRGTWTGDFPMTFAIQWFRGATAIPGAKLKIYTVLPADARQTLKCVVTATGIGTSLASSATVNVPAPPPPPQGVASAVSQTDLVARNGATTVTVNCSAVGPCAGVLVISATTQGGKAVAAAAKHKHKHKPPRVRTTIGKRSFSLAAGQPGQVVVVLTRQGRSLVSHAKHGLAVTLAVGRSSAHATLKAAG